MYLFLVCMYLEELGASLDVQYEFPSKCLRNMQKEREVREEARVYIYIKFCAQE